MSVTSTPSSPVYYVTSSVTVTCTVELNSAVLESDLSLLMVSAQLTHPNGTILSLSNTTRGITFTYTTQINSFRRSDSGNYLCTATVSPLPSNSFLSGGGSQSGTLEVAVGEAIDLTLELIPYSGKLSREKTFTNFAIFQPSAKVFSTKF